MYTVNYELNLYYEFSKSYESLENLQDIMDKEVLKFAKENKVETGKCFIFAEIFKGKEDLDSVSYFAEIAKDYSKIVSDSF